MGNIFNRYNINRALLSVTLISFSLTYPIQIQSAPPQGVNFNDVAFFVRLEKEVERLVKSEGKPIEKIIECLVDVKHEVETYYNTRLDIDQYMKNVEREIKKQGVKVPKKELDLIKKKIKAREKKNNKHAHYIASVIDLEGYQMNQYDEDMMFICKASKHKDKEDDKEEVVLPALLVYGVSVTLVGLFLFIIPIPACKDWGGKLMLAGVTACANSISSKVDENNKKDKEKKK
jgi:hypothetical protein